MRFKRLVIVSDLHCGHRVGLTSPGWMYPIRETTPERKGYGRLQRELWKHYARTLKELQPIDWLVCNGDALDGKGGRSGGVECITTDMTEQVDMAYHAIAEANAKRHLFTYGTPYHVGPDGEDWEAILASRFDARIGGHEWLDINGVVFDFKHKVGSSNVPHGRHTAVSRERMWNLLWHERDFAPLSNVFIRSHVHYHEFSGNPTHLAMTTPALQGPGSSYGVRQCSGVVDFGLIHFDIYENGRYVWQPHLLEITSARPQAVKG